VVARRHVSAHDADDVAQEAVTRAWRNRASCRTPEEPWAWLATIARREAIRKATAPVALVPAEHAAEAGAIDRELEEIPSRLAFERAVATLKARDQAIVRLHYADDWTVEAIARELGVPSGTVKVTLQRIRAKLSPLLLP
jgi:RNA polymerase sigma-70 factor, ECF subfamily